MATYKHLATTTLTSTGTTSITLSSISQDYDDLMYFTSFRGTGNFNTGTDVAISYNIGGTFSGQTGYAYSTNLGADTGANRGAGITGANSQAGSFNSGMGTILNYSTSSANNGFFSMTGWTSNVGAYFTQGMTTGFNSASGPITSITFTSADGSFVAGSSVSLYGIKRS